MDTWSPAPTSPPPGTPDANEPFSASFDLGRGLYHGLNALKRSFPVLFVGAFLRFCSSGGGSSGNSWSNDDTELLKSLKSLKQHSSTLVPGDHSWAGAPQVGSGLPSIPGLDDGALAALGIGVLLAIGAFVLVLLLLKLALHSWITPGWIRNYAELIRTGNAEWSTLFGAKDVFWRSLGWTCLYGAISIAGTVFAALGFLPALFMDGEELIQGLFFLGGALWALMVLIAFAYVFLGLVFVDHAIALDELPVMEAIGRSWSLASGNRLWIFLYSLVYGLIFLVVAVPGYCFCLVGVFLSFPIAYVMMDFGFVEGYLRRTRPDEIGSWSIEQWGGS